MVRKSAGIRVQRSARSFGISWSLEMAQTGVGKEMLDHRGSVGKCSILYAENNHMFFAWTFALQIHALNVLSINIFTRVVNSESSYKIKTYIHSCSVFMYQEVDSLFVASLVISHLCTPSVVQQRLWVKPISSALKASKGHVRELKVSVRTGNHKCSAKTWPESMYSLKEFASQILYLRLSSLYIQ